MDSIQKFLDPATITAIVASVLHVANYNATAHLEYNTRIFTKIIGKHAIYFYAVYLVLSALVRDHFINEAMKFSQNSLVLVPADIASMAGTGLFVFGILLNLWTLQALGIKGMYNGDSFGFLMDAPVTGGPYKFFNDPQYFGTTAAFLGSALYYQSRSGYIITVAVGVIFYISVKLIEGPHLRRIYSNKNKSKKKAK